LQPFGVHRQLGTQLRSVLFQQLQGVAVIDVFQRRPFAVAVVMVGLLTSRDEAVAGDVEIPNATDIIKQSQSNIYTTPSE
jgi:hypothetical protein